MLDTRFSQIKVSCLCRFGDNGDLIKYLREEIMEDVKVTTLWGDFAKEIKLFHQIYNCISEYMK